MPDPLLLVGMCGLCAPTKSRRDLVGSTTRAFTRVPFIIIGVSVAPLGLKQFLPQAPSLFKHPPLPALERRGRTNPWVRCPDSPGFSGGFALQPVGRSGLFPVGALYSGQGMRPGGGGAQRCKGRGTG